MTAPRSSGPGPVSQNLGCVLDALVHHPRIFVPLGVSVVAGIVFFANGGDIPISNNGLPITSDVPSAQVQASAEQAPASMPPVEYVQTQPNAATNNVSSSGDVAGAVAEFGTDLSQINWFGSAPTPDPRAKLPGGVNANHVPSQPAQPSQKFADAVEGCGLGLLTGCNTIAQPSNQIQGNNSQGFVETTQQTYAQPVAPQPEQGFSQESQQVLGAGQTGWIDVIGVQQDGRVAYYFKDGFEQVHECYAFAEEYNNAITANLMGSGDGFIPFRGSTVPGCLVSGN